MFEDLFMSCSQVMRDMGFDYDPSTAGSSVRFDPPDKKDKVCFNMLRNLNP